MFRFTFTVYIWIAFWFNSYVSSSSMENYKNEIVQMFMECSKDYPITEEHVMKLKEQQLPEDENVKCLFACAFKKANVMDDQGMLSIDGMHEIGRKFLSDDPEKLQKSEEFIEACKSVNDADVNDGARGCDRAALIFKCSVDKSPQFAITV